MKSSIITSILGAAAGALLAGAAVFAAYRGILAIAVIMILCQILAVVAFVRATTLKRRASQEALDS